MALGLLSYRLRWGLTLSGWLALLLTSGIVVVALVLGIHPFLSITERTDAEYLVVEGWIQDYAIRAAKEEFVAGGYRSIVATGGPLSGLGGYRNDYGTSASLGAQRLKREGIAENRVHMAPSRVSARDRTYSSAIALREWFETQRIPLRTLNVVTTSVHARRTRLLFQRAFGPDVKIGIIGIPNPDYEARHWWRYSEGVRDVVGESISYLYARCFFFPTPTPSPKEM